jgi:hypothetical protein
MINKLTEPTLLYHKSPILVCKIESKQVEHTKKDTWRFVSYVFKYAVGLTATLRTLQIIFNQLILSDGK